MALALIEGRIEATVRMFDGSWTKKIADSSANSRRTTFRRFSARSSGLMAFETISTKTLIISVRICWPRSTPVLETVMADQQRAIWITVLVTAISAILGLLFAGLVGTGITRPVRLLLQGTREVEAGQLDRSIDVITRDAGCPSLGVKVREVF